MASQWLILLAIVSLARLGAAGLIRKSVKIDSSFFQNIEKDHFDIYILSCFSQLPRTNAIFHGLI